MVTLLILGLNYLLILALSVVLTCWVAKWLRSPTASWGRATLVVAGVNLIGSAATALILSLEYNDQDVVAFIGLLTVSVAFLAMLFVYQWAFRLTIRQLPALVALHLLLIGVGFSVALPVRWYAVEAFKVPTNGMAPTIVGNRLEGPCPKCSGRVIATLDEERHAVANHPLVGICLQCGEYSAEIQFFGRAAVGDRFLVNKLVPFERWDIVVFKSPTDPSVNYVQRVVGLPGEEIVIQDNGQIQIDGVEIKRPAFGGLASTKYSARPGEKDPTLGPVDYDETPLPADPRKPQKLADDEYFLLGDNTHRSFDSRFWGPVKRDAMIGTVTTIYWPFNRWRIFK